MKTGPPPWMKIFFIAAAGLLWIAPSWTPPERCLAAEVEKANPIRKSVAMVWPLEFNEEFTHAPFPYQGRNLDGSDFYDYVDPATGQRWRTIRNGERYEEEETYSDPRVYFYLPSRFNPNQQFCYLVFFRGILSDVPNTLKEFHIVEQIEKSGCNVILVAPELARNSADTSPGKFMGRRAFRRFMDEVARIMARRLGRGAATRLAQAPILLTAFSGGYKSVALILERGGLDQRINGVFLLDALYDDVPRYQDWWLRNYHHAFLVHIHTEGACRENSQILIEDLVQSGFQPAFEWPARFASRGLYFINSRHEHKQVPLLGPPEQPIASLLRRLKF